MLTYLKGDATNPQGEGTKIIAHCCNDKGFFGAGFTGALDARWATPREQYVKWSVQPDGTFGIGLIQIVPVGTNLYVANMVGQNGIVSSKNPKPVNYEKLGQCMFLLDEWINNYKKTKRIMSVPFKTPEVSIHCPFFGAGLAGGTWETIELLIKMFWKTQEVFVYDFSK